MQPQTVSGNWLLPSELPFRSLGYKGPICVRASVSLAPGHPRAKVLERCPECSPSQAAPPFWAKASTKAVSGCLEERTWALVSAAWASSATQVLRIECFHLQTESNCVCLVQPYLSCVRCEHSQTRGRHRTHGAFCASDLRFLLLRDQVGISTAFAKTGNAIFQVAQDGAQSVTLPHTKVSLPSLLVDFFVFNELIWECNL